VGYTGFTDIIYNTSLKSVIQTPPNPGYASDLQKKGHFKESNGINFKNKEQPESLLNFLYKQRNVRRVFWDFIPKNSCFKTFL